VVNLSDWIKEPGNRQKYRKWLQLPETQILIQGLMMEIRPRPVPVQSITPEIGLMLYGQACGEQRILDRIRFLPDENTLPEKVVATYNLRAVLQADGYNEVQVDEMIAKANKEGLL
jgi:hypothetical protein